MTNMKLCAAVFLSSTLLATAFSPPSALRLATTSGRVASARPLRRAGVTSTKAVLDLPAPVYTAATSLLLAYDSDGSKTDSLYNGVPATGAVEAPVWVPIAIAFGISVVLTAAIPLLLKPGSDAFNEQRNNIGVFSDKGTKEDQFK
mmetsp:Transcript_12726/g.32016  ORF Transcript_12726/g.32016 Transcript_12726/m.32016 type:complete len:146 (-) Transcript_12726:478-915(-)|eukprot:CAMPEP_0173424456 /NCGR_PEP_ID=MMETSP1357-20121228/4364_1 /TAXON_ID=77926 /ORGANISM="Hemiselmis rufescens, Strain PCC563" /LENGTH=145 /DNA_ID=CAMNT_0014387685 /DNA_START=72 /DNA_END=509 /DNA_ORIENTATION=-